MSPASFQHRKGTPSGPGAVNLVLFKKAEKLLRDGGRVYDQSQSTSEEYCDKNVLAKFSSTNFPPNVGAHACPSSSAMSWGEDTWEQEAEMFKAAQVAGLTIIPAKFSLACEVRQVVAFLSMTLSFELRICLALSLWTLFWCCKSSVL